LVLRDLEVECFVCRSGVSGQVFESFHDGRRSRGKVKRIPTSRRSTSAATCSPRRESFVSTAASSRNHPKRSLVAGNGNGEKCPIRDFAVGSGIGLVGWP
jgi:hypothetical protein